MDTEVERNEDFKSTFRSVHMVGHQYVQKQHTLGLQCMIWISHQITTDKRSTSTTKIHHGKLLLSTDAESEIVSAAYDDSVICNCVCD